MTDKEQIIIDGVDVSKCEYLKESFTGLICADCNKSNDCSKSPNCYFKQLARKTQECVLLSENLAIKEEEARHYLGEAYKYRKALEEIEEIIKEYDCVNCSEQHCEDCNKGEIFYIINKAKEEE